MTSFYELLKESENSAIDPRHAAELEVEWWRAHRDAQHAERGGSQAGLVEALADLYAYTYRQEKDEVRPAAQFRADAMELSDRWVSAGSDPENPLLAEERALLVRSYAALLAAVHR